MAYFWRILRPFSIVVSLIFFATLLISNHFYVSIANYTSDFDDHDPMFTEFRGCAGSSLPPWT